MPNLCEVNDCCGCSACFAACPKDAIKMLPNLEGFMHPQVDRVKCVDCHLCEKVCPVLKRDNQREPLAVYAAQAKDDELRKQSSSGGIFSLLARLVIANGGVVFGAAVRDDMMIAHTKAENEEELSLLRGSKYVQSDMGNTYVVVKMYLDSGRQVMFTGTPCQIAGLRKYLQREYQNLFCVDVVCYAVPSPLVWRKYLSARTKVDCEDNKMRKLTDVNFRDKRLGWGIYTLSLRYDDGYEYAGSMYDDAYMRGFLSSLFNRRSCEKCAFRGLRSGSDLTISDYWRVVDHFPDLSDDVGTSLVLVNNSKGRAFIDGIGDKVKLYESSFAKACEVNKPIVKSFGSHANRGIFFRSCTNANFNFDRTVARLLNVEPSIATKAFKRIKRVIRRVVNG